MRFTLVSGTSSYFQKQAGRFFDGSDGQANILLENHVKIKQQAIDAWGNDYEKTAHGLLDFLLVDNQNKTVCALEAKKESPIGSWGRHRRGCMPSL